MVGFIGLGVMGEPMCRHILQRGLAGVVSSVVGFDLATAPLQRLQGHGLQIAASAAECAATADLILISLPGDTELEALCTGPDGLFANVRAGQTIVDLGTTSVKLSRSLRDRFVALDVAYADAPVARTRAAAESGTLLVLVGSSEEVFARPPHHRRQTILRPDPCKWERALSAAPIPGDFPVLRDAPPA